MKFNHPNCAGPCPWVAALRWAPVLGALWMLGACAPAPEPVVAAAPARSPREVVTVDVPAAGSVAAPALIEGESVPDPSEPEPEPEPELELELEDAHEVAALEALQALGPVGPSSQVRRAAAGPTSASGPPARPSAAAPPPPAGSIALARLQFREGTEAYQKGDYAKARECFIAAYRIQPLPQMLYNVAMAELRLGRIAQACLSYARFRAKLTAQTGASPPAGELARQCGAP